MVWFLLVSMTPPGLFPVKPTFVLSVTHSSREALTHTLCQELCGLTSHAHAGGYCGIRHDDRTALGIVQLTQTHTHTHTHTPQNTSTRNHTKTCIQNTINRGTQINTFNPKVKDKTVGKGLKCLESTLWWIETEHINRQTDRQTEGGRTITACCVLSLRWWLCGEYFHLGMQFWIDWGKASMTSSRCIAVDRDFHGALLFFL